MSEELISGYIDRSKFSADTTFILDQLSKVIEQFNKMKEFKIDIKGADSLRGVTTAVEGAAQSQQKFRQNVDNMDKGLTTLSLTTANYKKFLAALSLETENLTEEQLDMVKSINNLYKVEEQQRVGASETVKLIQTEIALQEKLEAGKSSIAQSNAKALAQLKDEKLERDRLGKLQAQENNSIAKSQAIIDLLINKKKKLNLETEQGQRVNEAFNKAIEKQNAFILANADVESKRFKNIGNYNAAAQLIIDALEKEKKKLEELEKTKIRVQNVGGGTFRPSGGEGGGTGRTVVAGFGGGGQAGFSQIQQGAAASSVEVDKLNKEIEETRVRIEGFQRAAEASSKVSPINAASAVKETEQLSNQLKQLEKAGLGTSAVADEIRNKLKLLESQMVNTGASAQAVKALDVEIANLNTQLKSATPGTLQYEKLVKQMELLKSVSGTLNTSFPTTKKEFRALEEAAQRLGAEFGKGSDQFRNFSKVVGSQKDQLGDIKSAIKFQSSDTKYLDATLQGVQAITSAYGAYAGVVALTGENNEELQKQMVKLQAVTALVSSVQGITNALQTEGAFIQGLLAVKASALALANKFMATTTVEASVGLGTEAVAAEAAAISLTELTAAEAAAAGTGAVITAESTAAATALGAEAVAANGLTVGLGGVAAGEAAVATGAVTMASAIAATGIGLLVIGLSIAVYKIITSIQDWNKENASLKKSLEDIVTSLKSVIDATKEYEAASKLFYTQEIARQEKINAAIKARGVTAAQGLALDKQIADIKLKQSEEDIRTNQITDKTLDKRRAEYLIDKGRVQAAAELRQRYIETVEEKGDKNYEKNIKRHDETIQRIKDEGAITEELYQRDNEIFQANADAKAGIASLESTVFKLNADQRRKFTLESARLTAEAQIASNTEILNSELSTHEERIKMLKSNLKQQQDIIEAENVAVQNDPTVSNEDKIISQNKTDQAIINAKRESRLSIAREEESYRVKTLVAETEINKQILAVVDKYQTLIYNSEAASYEQRLLALTEAGDARKRIAEEEFNKTLSTANISSEDIEKIKAEGFFKIENKKITDAELQKLIVDYNTQVQGLAFDLRKEEFRIGKDYYIKDNEERGKRLKEIELETAKIIQLRTEEFSDDTVSLNDKYKSGEITFEEFNNQKLKLQSDYSKDSIQNEINRVEKSLAASRKAVDIQKQIEAEIASLKNPTGPERPEDTAIRFDRIAELDRELESIKATVGEESKLYTDLANLRAELSNKSTEEFIADQDKAIAKLKEIASAAISVIESIASVSKALSDRQLKQIEGEKEAIDKRSAQELDANEKSSLSDKDKAEKKSLIEAKAIAQKEVLEEKEKAIKRRQAQQDKALAIFKIILATAIAIAEAKGNVFKIALAAVSGAAQLAVALATPLPKFKQGKDADNKYEGLGIVDDGGKNEPILRSDGTIELSTGTPKDTVKWIGANDIIYPSVDAMLKQLAMPQKGLVNKYEPKITLTGNGNLEMHLAKQTQILQKIANKRELNMNVTETGIVAMHQHATNRISYLEEQTNWNK